MPIPHRLHDMKKVSEQIEAGCRDGGSDGDERREAAQAAYDDERRRWLDQYDDNGYLKPGIFGTADYIPNRTESFLRMASEERAAFVVAEKKRLGLL